MSEEPDPPVPVLLDAGVHAAVVELVETMDPTVDPAGRTAAVAAFVAAASCVRLDALVGAKGDAEGSSFRKRWSEKAARPALRQETDLEFVVLEPFTYPDGSGGTWVVPAGMETDLASVPLLLTWLVPRYGRHTLPALLHDYLQHSIPPVDSWRADEVFRDAMGEAGVPLVRRWAMWAAVATRSLIHETLWWWVLLGIWGVGYGVGGGLVMWPWVIHDVARNAPWLGALEVGLIALSGVAVILGDGTTWISGAARWARRGLAVATVVLGVGVAVWLALRGETWVPLAQILVLLSPVVLGGFWWTRAYRIGLIAGVALALLAIPALLVGWAVLVYRAAEGTAILDPNPVTRREAAATQQT